MKRIGRWLLKRFERVFQFARSLLHFIWLIFVRLWKDPAFLIAVVTAFVLLRQNDLLSRELNLLEQNVRYEQKPMINLTLGYMTETTVYNNALSATRSILNIGKLPAYNINLRWATRRSDEYPNEFFEEGMQDDSIYFNILYPGTPWLDNQRITLDSNVNSLTTKEIAYEMYSEDLIFYIHYWLEYQDISGRFYVLQETISLHGSSDSTLFWSQDYARDIDYSER